MWTLEYSTQFKKDLKRIKHQAAIIQVLKDVLNHLAKYGTVDRSLKPHMLSGEYFGCMECHVQNDFLLIWIDKDTQTIKLVRTGTHAELFK